ncbi:MAG: type II toxin-antitoxin system HicA family toxin [Thermacetogeniaceae bacterium]
MGKWDKLFNRLLNGRSDTNISFSELCNLLDWLGFEKRTSAGHHIFYKDGIDEIINLQPIGVLAKAYQIKQVRNIILKYRLGGGEDV